MSTVIQERPCVNCGKLFTPRVVNYDYSKADAQRFCCRACVASHRWASADEGTRARMDGVCESCGEGIRYRRSPSGGVTRRRLCAGCLAALRARGNPVANQTKGQLFANRKSWQSARTAIRRHAYQVFAATDLPLVCQVCAYTKHAEIAHRRGVSEFPDWATVAEINDPSNLFALCPNCHWEFDHGLLVL